jgi:hypothetical protein
MIKGTGAYMYYICMQQWAIIGGQNQDLEQYTSVLTNCLPDLHRYPETHTINDFSLSFVYDGRDPLIF